MKRLTNQREVLDGLKKFIVQTIHPEKIILFGSRARGDAGDRSDIDLAIETQKTSSWTWSKFVLDLKEQNQTLLPIDVVRLEKAKPSLKRMIEKEGIFLYKRAHRQD